MEGLGLERIAELSGGVHRVTISRRLEAARSALFKAVRDEFVRNAGITPDEFDSLAPLLRSQLELSLDALKTDAES
jgi:hypothetical protein